MPCSIRCLRKQFDFGGGLASLEAILSLSDFLIFVSAYRAYLSYLFMMLFTNDIMSSCHHVIMS